MGNLLGDRYLENTHCEGSVLLQLVVGAVLGLGGLPGQPVFVPPAAHVLEEEKSQRDGHRPGDRGWEAAVSPRMGTRSCTRACPPPRCHLWAAHLSHSFWIGMRPLLRRDPLHAQSWDQISSLSPPKTQSWFSPHNWEKNQRGQAKHAQIPLGLRQGKDLNGMHPINPGLQRASPPEGIGCGEGMCTQAPGAFARPCPEPLHLPEEKSARGSAFSPV